MDHKVLAENKESVAALFNEFRPYCISKNQDLSLKIGQKIAAVRLASRESENFDFWHLKNTAFGKEHSVKLKTSSNLSFQSKPANIIKENQNYIIKLTASYTGIYQVGMRYIKAVMRAFNRGIPLGYRFEVDYSHPGFTFFEKKDRHYAWILLIEIAILFFICAIIFESLLQPLIVLSIIPFSYIDVFLTFYWYRFPFDQGGFAGLLLIGGLTVNSSIYIISEYNHLKAKFSTVPDFLIFLKAMKNKIYPIFLTIITTILASIPFVISGQEEVFWFSFSVCLISGLAFSFLAVIFLLPLFLLRPQKKLRLR